MTPSAAINALIANGMSETAIGEAVGARQNTINRIKRGVMVPNWETGQKLVALALSSIPASNDDAEAA